MRDVFEQRLELAFVAARGRDRFDEARVDRADRSLDDRLDEQLAAAEMVEHGRVRDAGVFRDFLEPDPGGSHADQAALGRIENQLSRRLGVEPPSRFCLLFRHIRQECRILPLSTSLSTNMNNLVHSY